MNNSPNSISGKTLSCLHIMTTAKALLAVSPLTRKYDSMTTLANKSVQISLEYKDETKFLARRISSKSDSPETGKKQIHSPEARALPMVLRSSETPAASIFRRENGTRNLLLERRQAPRGRQESGAATKTPNNERIFTRSPGKQRLHMNVEFIESRRSDWINRLSAFNNRINANTKTQQQSKKQGLGTNFSKVETIKSTKPKMASTMKMKGKQKNSLSEVLSLEREFQHQTDYRQKCIQWLKSLPDGGIDSINPG